MSPPLVVLADAAAVDAAGVQLRRKGHDCRAGFDIPEPFPVGERRIICSGGIDDLDVAREALLAAARGAGLLLWLDDALDAEIRSRFLSDLARLGPVRTDEVDAGPAPILTLEQRELLALVAEGASIPDAAAQLYVSVRTAERRMAQARAALGVRTTAAAAVAFQAGRR